MAKKKSYQDDLYTVRGGGGWGYFWTRLPLDDDCDHPLRQYVDLQIGDFIERKLLDGVVTEFWPVYLG